MRSTSDDTLMTTPAEWTADDVRDHLAQRLPDWAAEGEPERLPEGRLNWVWRVTTDRGPVIVKVAPPFIAAHPDVALSPERVRFEAKALEALAPDGDLADVASDTARAPRLLDLDAERHALVVEDLGDLPHLGTWLYGTDKTSARAAGEALGQFIGRLHLMTLDDEAVAEAFDNEPAQQTRHAVQYQGTRPLLEKLRLPDAASLADRAEELGERFLEAGRCLTMGDLWPLAVLVDEAEEESPRLGLIDWGLAHYGNPAQDLGHLAAHFWIHAQHAERAAQRNAVRAARQSFFEGYAQVAGERLPELIEGPVLRDAALHAACEVLVRSIGPLQEGSLYEGLPLTDAAVRKATRHAVALLRRPGRAAFVAPLRAILSTLSMRGTFDD